MFLLTGYDDVKVNINRKEVEYKTHINPHHRQPITLISTYQRQSTTFQKRNGKLIFIAFTWIYELCCDDGCVDSKKNCKWFLAGLTLAITLKYFVAIKRNLCTKVFHSFTYFLTNLNHVELWIVIKISITFATTIERFSSP